jgi:hypothetical protein
MYLWRNLRRHLNPNPPALIDLHPADKIVPDTILRPHEMVHAKQFRGAPVRAWR